MAGNEVGHERLGSGHLRGARGAVYQRQYDNVPYLDRSKCDEDRKHEVLREVDGVHGRDDLAPIEPVGEVAGDRGYENPGNHRGEGDAADP